MSKTQEISENPVAEYAGQFDVLVHGEFRIEDSDGNDLTPRSEKACALMAMLLVTPDHARSRIWLRQHLWSDRGVPEGQSSLRQCLSEIRRLFAPHEGAVGIDRRMVRLNTAAFKVKRQPGVFLESLSIQDPTYLSWVDDMRRRSSFASTAQGDDLITAQLQGQQGGVPANVQFSYPTIAVETEELAHVTPALAEAMHKLRVSLTKFRWLSVQNSTPGPVTADYIVRLGQDSDLGQINCVNLTTAKGQMLWSERYGDEEDFATNIPFLDSACGNIAVLVSNAEEQRAADAPIDNDLCNLLWRGRWHLNHMSQRDAKQATELFNKAQQLAPNDANVAIDIAYAAVARAWVFRLDRAALDDIIRIAKRATARAPTDARGFYNLGTALCFAREQEGARIAIDEAIRLCPNMAMAWIQQGCNLLGEGRFEDAIPVYHRCLTLGRFERRSYVPRCGLAMAHLFLGQEAEAIEVSERAIALRPGYWYAHLVRGVACWRIGRKTQARQSLATMRTIYPGVSRQDVEWLPNGDKAALDRLILDAGLAD